MKYAVLDVIMVLAKSIFFVNAIRAANIIFVQNITSKFIIPKEIIIIGWRNKYAKIRKKI